MHIHFGELVWYLIRIIRNQRLREVFYSQIFFGTKSANLSVFNNLRIGLLGSCRQNASVRHQPFGEHVTREAKHGDEVEYLKIILDSLVGKHPLLEKDDVSLSRQFLQELKHSVDSRLKLDSRIEEDARSKVLNAFNVLIDNCAKSIEVLP